MKCIMRLGLMMTVFLSCDPPSDTRLKLYNKASFPVFFMQSIDYPDTVIYRFNSCTSNILDASYLQPGETDSSPTGPGGNWENTISRTPSQTIMFFVFRADSASKYATSIAGCDSLAKRRDLVLKRFDVTVDYLKKNNWTLTYP